MCADPLVAEHVDLDRQPLVEKFVVLDAEVDVDQRLLPAVLTISRRIRLEESTRCDRRADIPRPLQMGLLAALKRDHPVSNVRCTHRGPHRDHAVIR